MDSILQGRFTPQSSEFLLKTGHFIQGPLIINLPAFNDGIDFPDVPFSTGVSCVVAELIRKHNKTGFKTDFIMSFSRTGLQNAFTP